MFAIHIISKNQDFRSPITDVRVSGRPKMTVSGPKWVAVNSNGLKLWENDATGLRIIFKLLFWHSGPKIYQKIKNLELNQIGQGLRGEGGFWVVSSEQGPECSKFQVCLTANAFL